MKINVKASLAAVIALESRHASSSSSSISSASSAPRIRSSAFLARRAFTSSAHLFTQPGLPVFASATSSAEEHRVYLNAGYEDREEVKRLGAKFDFSKKKWYITADQPREPFDAFLRSNVYLSVPFHEKDEAKALGAKFDFQARKWYVPSAKTSDMGPFQRWLEPGYVAMAVKKNGKSRVAVSTVVDADTSDCYDSSTDSLTTDVGTDAPSVTVATNPNCKVLFFDLETSGFPTGSNSVYTDLIHFESSRIVQIGCMLCERSTLETVEVGNQIVRADDFVIPDHVAKVHGISTERSLTEGVAFVKAIETLYDRLFRPADIIVAHNAKFDVPVFQAELFRSGLHDQLEDFKKKQVCCTMLGTKEIVRAVSLKTGKIKNPSLKDLYSFAMGLSADSSSEGAVMTGHHDALYDVMNLRDAIKALQIANLYRI